MECGRGGSPAYEPGEGKKNKKLHAQNLLISVTFIKIEH